MRLSKNPSVIEQNLSPQPGNQIFIILTAKSLGLLDKCEVSEWVIKNDALVWDLMDVGELWKLVGDLMDVGELWKLMTTSSANNSVFWGFFEKQKLTGPNFIDWYRQLRIVLSIEDKLNYLEQTIPSAPPVALEGQQEEGQTVSSYVLKMKGYIDNLERLGHPVTLGLGGLRASRKLKPRALSLFVGNGQRKAIEAIGVFYLCLSSILEIVLNNFHYAPSITRGVISVSRLDSIFEIDLSNSYANDSFMYAISNKRAKLDLDSGFLWHCRLGHISKKLIEKLQHDGLLNSTDLRAFEKCISLFQKEVEKQLGKTIKSLRSDRGGEYMSQEFLYHLKDHGIITHRTPPYTPQHNEVSERRNRTLLDMVRSMMSQTTLTKSFWDYALETAVRILNMVPTKKVEKTPYEVWHGKASKLSYLKFYGCEALVKRDTLTKPDKLEPSTCCSDAKFLENNLIIQEASGSLKDLEIIQEEDMHPSIDTSLNQEEDDQEINEPQSDINPIHRSTRTRRPTDRMCLYIDAEEYEFGDLGEPANYKAALLDPESDKCLNAMNVEMQSMKENKVWNLVELPPNGKTIGSKWLFKKKTDMDGAVHTYKARLVAKGYTQTPGIDYEETFSTVVKLHIFLESRSTEIDHDGDIKLELMVSCYTDAGYLTDADDLKSQIGYVFVLNGGAVDWKSAKQSIFATSSAKAEYIATFDAYKEAVWESLKIVNYLREVIEYGDVKLEKVHTDDNLADPFTKALAFQKHSGHTKNIRIFPMEQYLAHTDYALWEVILNGNSAVQMTKDEAESTSSTNEFNAAYCVYTTTSHISCAQGSSSYADELMFSLFSNQSSSPQLDNEDLEQIDQDDLEEMNLKWQVAMLSMRVKRFYKKTGRKLEFNGKEQVDFDKTKVECFNCHKRGHFARDCRSARNSRNRSRDARNARYRERDNGKRPAKEEDENTLVVQDGLGYDSQLNEKEVLDVKEEEVTETVFDNRSSDVENSLANDRFKKGEGYHAVPPPLTSNYMPPKFDLSFAGLDDSIYKFKISETVTSLAKDAPETSTTSVEKPKEDRSSAPLIQDWETDSDNDSVFKPKPISAKIDFLKVVFTRSGRILVSAAKPKAATSTSVAKPVNTTRPKQSVNFSKSRSTFHKPHSPIRRSFYNATAHSRRNSTKRVNTAGSKAGHPQKTLKNKGIVNSECSRHMTGNKAYLADYQEINDGGFVAFGSSRDKITGKGNQTNKNAGLQDTNGNACTQDNVDVGKEVSDQLYIVFPLWSSISSTFKSSDDKAAADKPKDDTGSKTVKEPINKEDQAYSDEFDRLISQEKEASDAADAFRKEFEQRCMDQSGVTKAGSTNSFNIISNPVNVASTSVTFSVAGPSSPHPDAFIPANTLLHILDEFHRGAYILLRTIASTPIETQKPLVKDEEAADVTPKLSHLHAVKRIFRHLKGQPKLGLWKSTTRGCQFLGRRLISWQCKNQTIVATSTTEAEYVVAANWCGQVLWIQNQMLDYGFNFMNTKIYIDNESTICIVKNPVYHSKTKHIEIMHHFIRDSYEKNLIQGNNGDKLVSAAGLAQPVVVEGEGSGNPPESQPTPSLAQPINESQIPESSSSPQNTQSPRQTLEGTGFSQTRGPNFPDPSVDVEAVHKEGVTVCDPPLSTGHTVGSGEDMIKHELELTDPVPQPPHDSPLSGGHTPGSDEGKPNINELMNLCTQLSDRFFALEQFKTTQDLVIQRLLKKVKRLEKKQRVRTPRMKLFKIDTSKKKTLDKENVSRQGRDESNKIEKLNISDKGSGETKVFDYTTAAEKDVNAAEPVSTAGDAVNVASVILDVSVVGPSTSTVGDIFEDEMITMANTLMAIRRTRPKITSVVIHDVEEEPRRATPPPIVQSQDKGKGKMVKPEPISKNPIKARIQRDAEIAQRLFKEEQAQFEREQRIAREKAAEQEAKDATLIEQMEDVQSRIDADALLAERIQQKEREQFTVDEQARIEQQAESSKKRLRVDHDKENDIAIDVESLAIKYLIVDWKTHTLTKNMMYYQIIKATGSSKNYKILTKMCDDFDRQDIMDLYRLVKERYETASPEGYDLLLWGDLITLFEPSEEDVI
nr:hypothetical protein [Tanacetum cinerariifolium]